MVGEELIPLHELRKLADLFPTEDLLRSARTYSQEPRAGSELVPNPLGDMRHHIFMSSMARVEQSLAHQIQSAVESKLSKKHEGKSATILVIDNRTSVYGLADYRHAVDELVSFLAEIPFPEVWFYTGYYSDDDGSRAEFSFAPLKVTPEQAAVLSSMDVDSKGVHLWA